MLAGNPYNCSRFEDVGFYYSKSDSRSEISGANRYRTAIPSEWGKKQPAVLCELDAGKKMSHLPPRGNSALIMAGGSIHHDRRKRTAHRKEFIQQKNRIIGCSRSLLETAIFELKLADWQKTRLYRQRLARAACGQNDAQITQTKKVIPSRTFITHEFESILFEVPHFFR